ncbi:aminotransferase class V-fold PLP-dependent enzyme [Aerococcus christensenii]|uniref:aminotransferase class V-fold PLP-dependent enzyme n=1 Tax=Aerococcus christensenii TaxID=87541 RepID=UPI003F434FC0
MNKQLKASFPILQNPINGQRLVYLDNAATTQKPKEVLEAILSYYKQDNANTYRGVYTLAAIATEAYEEARNKVQDFIHAENGEVVFTKGTTQGLNWVADRFLEKVLKAGDEILISPLEHHSNLLPWQQMAKKRGYLLKYLPMKADGKWSKEDVQAALSKKTKILAIAHVSNVLGSIQDLKELADVIHSNSGYLVVDGAQAVAHLPIDVKQMGCDFYCFSGHKMYGPTGIGVLYGKRELLEEMEPAEYGGEMITSVSKYDAKWAELPLKWEAGTQNIAGAIGLGQAIDWIKEQDLSCIHSKEQQLISSALKGLQEIPSVTVYGPKTAKNRCGVISFNLEGVHPHDLATGLDQYGIAIRAGHHCAQPLMKELGITASARISFAVYNTEEDVQIFLQAIKELRKFFQ